jgi:hypothetical protein
MSSANQRSYDYKNTLQIARSKHKKIVYLEKRNHISPLRLVGFASLGYGVTLFLWIARFFSKDNVDKGLREALKDKSENKSIHSLTNTRKRDLLMSRKILQLLKKNNSILVVIGKEHVKGILENLKKANIFR